MALRQKKVKEEAVEKAISKLEEKDYLKMAKSLIERKQEQLSESDARLKKSKVYYYMISKGYESDLVMKILGEKAIPLQKIRADIPDAIATGIMQCLKKDPDRRLQNIRELRQCFEHY